LERKTPFHQENKKTLIIPSTGNFGISLATLAAPKYRVICILPERITNDRIALLKALGVEILRSPNEAKPEAPESAYSVATKLAEQLTDAVVMDEVKYVNNIRGGGYFLFIFGDI
jgi:cystathionine beta-synthase